MDPTRVAIEREQAIGRRRAMRWSTTSDGRGLPLALAPTERDDEPAWIHPQRDVQGRPRVRVLLSGSVWSGSNATARALDALLGRERRWPSPRREYEFVQRVGVKLPMSDDPSIPLIGVVYAPYAKKNAPFERSLELWTYSALGFPPPLLWLQGIGSSRARDENVLRVREHVESLGFRADESPVLCAHKINAASLDALVDALDQHCDGRELFVREPPSLRFAEAALRYAREERALDTTLFAGMLSLIVHHGFSDAVGSTLAAIADALLTRDEVELCARALATSFVRDASAFDRWTRAEVARAEPSRTQQWSVTLRAYAAIAPDAAVASMIAMIEHDTLDARSSQWIDALLSSSAQSRVAQIAAAIERGAPGPARERLQWIYERIRSGKRW